MTITRTTSTGKQEVLLTSGFFKTREVIERDGLQIQYFDNIEGSKKVKELRADCRIPQMKKSIILNYS